MPIAIQQMAAVNNSLAGVRTPNTGSTPPTIGSTVLALSV